MTVIVEQPLICSVPSVAFTEQVLVNADVFVIVTEYVNADVDDNYADEYDYSDYYGDD